MRCLVLGGAGFLGSHLCRGLLAAGHDVRVFEKRGVGRGNIADIEDRLEIIEDDFSDSHGVREALRGMSAVFHLVGTTIPKTSNEDVVFDVMSNVVPTLHLFEGCREHGIKKVIFASSGGTVYGVPDAVPIAEDHPTRPICAYGTQKLTIEKYLEVYRRMSGSDYTVLRIANPYGAGQRPDGKQGAVAVFVNRAVRGEPIEIWGDGKVVRDYVHVSDVVEAFKAALSTRGASRIYNIGSGQGHTLLEIIERIEGCLGRPVAKNFLPARDVDVPANVLCIERAKQELGWTPKILFADGVARAVAECKRDLGIV